MLDTVVDRLESLVNLSGIEELSALTISDEGDTKSDTSEGLLGIIELLTASLTDDALVSEKQVNVFYKPCATKVDLCL